MRSTGSTKFVSTMMACMLSVSLIAADRGAMLYPVGGVTVNGADTNRSRAIFDGDQVKTGADAGTTIMVAGSTVQVTSNSAITFRNGEIDLAAGGASIRTTNRMRGRIANVDVTPVAKSTFQIIAHGNEVVIAAREGAVQLFDGHESLMVPEGKAFTAPIESSTADPQQHPVPAASVGITLSKGQLKAIAAVAAAGGALAALLLADRAPGSPSAP